MTKTIPLQEVKLTTAILDWQSLGNIVEDHELSGALQNYVTFQALEDMNLNAVARTAAAEECAERCYGKNETSSSAEIASALARTATSSIEELDAAFSKKLEKQMPECYADGLQAIAFGLETSAAGDFTHAEGCATSATGFAAHVEGDSTEAYGDFSHAEGLLVQAADDYAHAEGSLATAASYGAHAEGGGSIAGYAVKVGQLQLVSCVVDPETYVKKPGTAGSAVVRYDAGTTENYNPEYDNISVSYKIVFDQDAGSAGKKLADAIGANEIVFSYEGQNAETRKLPTTVEVGSITAIGYGFTKLPASMMWENRVELRFDDGTAMFGFVDKISMLSAGTFFSSATPTANSRVDFYVLNAPLPNVGWLDIDASTQFGHAEGYGTFAHGRAAHAEGEKTRAIGSISHAEGYDTTAIGHGSRVNGVHSFAEGKYATAIGKCVNAKGDYSIALGFGNTSKDARSFTWSGVEHGHDLTAYQSKGIGTFCINPTSGIDGFYIGDKTFADCVREIVQSMST